MNILSEHQKFKDLTLIRHAKSSWDYPELSDKQRPLSARGQKDIKLMAANNAERLRLIEVFFVSCAKRARQTVKAFRDYTPVDNRQIENKESLYTFDKEDLLDFLQNLDDKYRSIALVGHNPALTELTNALVEDSLSNIPTCGIVQIQFDCTQWQEILDCHAKLVYFDRPKNYKKD